MTAVSRWSTGCTVRAGAWLRAAVRWVQTYREPLVSWEGIATLVALAILIASWAALLAGSEATGRVLACAAALAAGTPIWWSTARGLWQRDFTVDVLVSAAIGAALVVGQYQAGAIVAVMLLGGGLLEQLTVARASRALVALLARVPTTAALLRDGREVPVSVDEIRQGDRVRVRTGGMVPVDGTVEVGHASVDQSSITGESLPVDKGPGDRVFAGTLNRAGALDVRATQVGAGTTLGKIIALVEAAQRSTAPVQRLASRYAQFYAPLAFTLAVAVYAMTGDVLRAIAILIVFCPCALVLATPTAVIAGIGNAARRTVLVKGGARFEAAGRVDVVAFDKTGTLTRGEPAVTDVIGLDGLAPDASLPGGASAPNPGGAIVPVDGGEHLLRLAAAAEELSEHPLGRAIVAEAARRGLQPPGVQGSRILPGIGVEACVDGRQVFVGRLGDGDGGAAPEAAVRATVETLEQEGKTVLAVVVGGRLAGLIGLRDVVRPGVPAVIAAIQRTGVGRVLLMTGDSRPAALAVARQIGVGEVHAGLLPEDKLALVRELQRQGLRVAVVGDGVNDAPALAAADVGIAMGAAGTDVAIETADIALMSSDLARVPEVLGLARRALRVIRQNVLLSIGINLVAVVLAGLGIVTPVLGAVIHEASAMLVVVNAVRLMEWRPPQAA
ncbi:MAG: cation-translocating P-type ATPase [Candidatus Latescibacterota bacterium]